MKMRDGLIVLTVMGLIVGVFFLKQQESTPTSIEPNQIRNEEGSPAPEFSLDTLTGEKVTLSEEKGKPTLLIFWASWCKACRSEMPAIQKIYEEYKDTLNVFAVNATHQDKMDDITRLIENQKYLFPVLLDQEGTVFNQYGVKALPTLFLLSDEGVIKMKKVGTMAEEDLKSKIDELLQK